MDPRDAPPADGRPETLLAATILLMSAHARDGGPRLADACCGTSSCSQPAATCPAC